MPRRKGAFHGLGYALSAAFGPINPKVKAHTWGHNPEDNLAKTAGRSHRREANPGGNTILKWRSDSWR